LSYRKATEKKRIPNNLNNVIGGQQEKQKSRHETDAPCLTGTNVKEARHIGRQKAQDHSSNILRPR
jgi:hypothetical protein